MDCQELILYRSFENNFGGSAYHNTILFMGWHLQLKTIVYANTIAPAGDWDHISHFMHTDFHNVLPKKQNLIKRAFSFFKLAFLQMTSQIRNALPSRPPLLQLRKSGTGATPLEARKRFCFLKVGKTEGNSILAAFPGYMMS